MQEQEQHDPAAYREQKLRDEIADIMSQLKTVADTDRPRMTERIFSQIFLPFFAGDQELMYKVTLQHWINAIGGPFLSVDVVDQKNAVLFTVPPLLDRSAISPIAKEGVNSIAHVVASATQLARIHPSQGSRHLSAELTKRALVMKVPTSVLQNLETWNKIFERYGRPPIVALEEEQKQDSTPAPSAKDNDDYDFEPL